MRATILCALALATAASAAPLTETYRDAQLGFTIAYPAHWTVDTHFVNDISPPIHGVSFTISADVNNGTNLGSDTRLSVEHVDAGPCTASRFIDQPENEHSITEDGRTYDVGTFDDAGAGNRYEETVYAFAHGGICYGVHNFIHYSAIGNYDPGTVREFDRGALTAAFDAMRHSLAFTN